MGDHENETARHDDGCRCPECVPVEEHGDESDEARAAYERAHGPEVPW